jgi:hypothetical protein
VPAGEILDALSRLADKSLVTVSDTGTDARFGQLQTLWQYGRERLTGRRAVAGAVDLIARLEPGHLPAGGLDRPGQAAARVGGLGPAQPETASRTGYGRPTIRCQVPRSTLAARTRTRISSAAIAGLAISASRSTASGAVPYSSWTIAVIVSMAAAPGVEQLHGHELQLPCK